MRVDIVSDVVCPWCVIGYYQLRRAAECLGIELDVHWHPFELNPSMPQQGQNLREHLAAKYGTTPADSRLARDKLTAIGAELGFEFDYFDEMRMFNTFAAHQLIDWAADFGQAHQTKLALFSAFFSQREDVSDLGTLVRIATDSGLDGSKASQVLQSGERSKRVRERQAHWIERGIQGVPAMVLGGDRLIVGAQGVDNYIALLKNSAAL